jgi:hypothetical protein
MEAGDLLRTGEARRPASVLRNAAEHETSKAPYSMPMKVCRSLVGALQTYFSQT